MITFDTSLYERPIRAPVVDTFDLGNARVTADDLRNKWTPAANRRHNKGEHATIVVGHTRDGMTREEDQPTVVGVLTGPFAYHDSWPGVDGPCVTGMHYISKERVVPCDGVPLKLSAKEILDRWPRRSAELWFSDYKIDPHCLLGATTPCRELGPLRLSRDGSLVVEREIQPLRLERESTTVADEKPQDAKPSEKDGGIQKQLEALTQTVMALSKQVESMASAGAAGCQQHDPQEDAEIEQLLQQLGGAGDDGTSDAPTDQPAPKPEKAKMSRETEIETELKELRVKLRRTDIVSDLKDAGFDKPEAQLIDDLAILPPDVYARQLDRLKLSRPAKTAEQLAAVVAQGNALATGTPSGKKKISSPEDTQAVVKLARAKGTDFARAAEELGFEVAGR